MTHPSPTCTYQLAYIGPCGQPADFGERCREHLRTSCAICDGLARYQCESGSSLICGAPLCDNPKCRKKHDKQVHGW